MAAVVGVLVIALIFTIAFFVGHKEEPTPVPTPVVAPIPSEPVASTTKKGTRPADNSSSPLNEIETTDGKYKIDLGDNPWRAGATPWKDIIKQHPKDLLIIYSGSAGKPDKKSTAIIVIKTTQWKGGSELTKQAIQQNAKLMGAPAEAIDGDPYPITIAGAKALGIAYKVESVVYVNTYYLEIGGGKAITLAVEAADKKTANELAKWLDGRVTRVS